MLRVDMTPSNLTTVPMCEEDMTRVKRLVLTHMRSTLVQSLDPRLFLTVFRQEFVLNARECDSIKSSCSRSTCEGAEVLLDTLATKGPSGYDILCRALLEDQTQLHLLTALGDTLALFKHNFLLYREGQIKAAEQQRKEMELHKQYNTQLKRPSLHLASNVNPPCFKTLHQARSPMPCVEPEGAYHPAYYYTNYTAQENEHYVQQIPHDEYSEYQSPQVQQAVPSMFHYHQPTPVLSTHHLQYPQHCFMSQHHSEPYHHDLPCGQQGN